MWRDALSGGCAQARGKRHHVLALRQWRRSNGGVSINAAAAAWQTLRTHARRPFLMAASLRE